MHHGIWERRCEEGTISNQGPSKRDLTFKPVAPELTEITKLLPYERFMGIQSTFERAGFKEVARRADRRPMMRYVIHPAEKALRS